MKRTGRRWLATGLRVLGALLLIVVLGAMVAFLPGRVEGVYYAGKLLQCPCGACDALEYLRFERGRVIVQFSHNGPAGYLGRYEEKPDGSVVVYMAPLEEEETEEVVMTLKRPRLGFAMTLPIEGESYLLLRAF